MSTYHYPEDRVAIIGTGGLFPDAGNVQTLWDNILNKKVSIREVTNDILEKSVFYRPDVFGKINKNDKTYTNIAAVPDLKDQAALSKKYKIPPTVAAHMDPNQHAAIYCVDQALTQLKSNLPKARTAVILGTGAPGKSHDNITRRTFFARVENMLRNNPVFASSPILSKFEEVIEQVAHELLETTLPVTEDSSPGMLQNITAARIANIFDFWGPSYTVDAACASALAATISSVAGLLNHEYDAVITGGVEVTLSETGFVAFSAINALSPDGSYPFDSRANGFVMGLGGGVLVLKRLSDAIRDGDNIISIISGYGQGSDGKGKYIAAPSEEGQVRVIQNACKMAGYSVDTIELIEAHGTGTIVGDVVEVAALKNAFSNLGAQRQNYCGVGSVKSNIGHLRYAAGVPGMIKASLALYNKVLPPTANIREINPKLQLEGSPFYILKDERPWKETSTHPRRANVSAYGFGGADYHICLEEFRPEFLKKSYSFSGKIEAGNRMKNAEKDQERQEVIFFSGDSYDEVAKAVSEFMEVQKDCTSFEKLAYRHNLSISSDKDWRLAVCANSFDSLKEKVKTFQDFAQKGNWENTQVLNLQGIYLGRGQTATPDKVAMMFPGQASQYPNMLRELYESYPSVESLYTQWDILWKAKYGSSIMPLLFGNDEEKMSKDLVNTKNTHPAVFLSNLGMHKLMTEAGIKADYMVGHSLGEISALYAGGMMDLRSAVQMVGARGFSFDDIPEPERGGMVSVKADRTKTTEIINESSLELSISNCNSPDQTVVGGAKAEIEKFTEFLNEQKVAYKVLPVSHAFHTNLTSPAAEAFYQKIAGIKFSTPKLHVMSCHLMDFYPGAQGSLQNTHGILKEQITSPVSFAESIIMLYEKGVRVFIETGPSNILSNLVRSILNDKDVKVVASNNRKKDSVEAFKQALAELFACGVDVTMVPSKQVLKQDERMDSAYNIHQIIPCLQTNASSTKMNDSVEACSPATQAASGFRLPPKESIVYSGVSAGLPGTFKKAFSDENFKLLFEGKNLIEMLTDDERESVLDLNITKLVKTEESSSFKKISSINEVIQLAGKLGKIDMLNDYLVDEKMLKQMTLTVSAGIAAGYEALKDAGIPLVREYKKTTSGTSLPGRLVLPEEMQNDTGIIFANGLFPLDSIISEVSKYIASKFGRKTRNDLIDFYEAVISKVSDYHVKKLLSDWYTLHYSRLHYNYGEGDVYEFNHHFMSLLYSQANNRLAQLINASGPNFYMSAACSSTASAVTVAEDMIRAGHAARMIVIGADLTSTKTALPWVGGGFLSMGGLTDSSSVFDAAVPFDNRRSGMILGAGAVGLVIEKEEDVSKRGMNGICRILGTHVFNTAGHQSKIESEKYCVELDRFLSKVEREHQLKREVIASKTVYCSHETYSPKKGGCSQTEKRALESAFGERYKELKVINVKGMTGHTMGASIEEAVAAKALQYQQIPPIVNYKEPDPELEGLNLSKGGSYNFEFVLRMIAAFGSQGNYHLLQRVALGDERICDKKAYREWIERVTGTRDATLKNCGRLLVAEGADNGFNAGADIDPIQKEVPVKRENVLQQGVGTNVSYQSMDITNEILNLYSEVTKYPKEMLDLSMEIEADLGIDTVKQATVFSMIADKYGISESEGSQLSNYPTIGHVVDFITRKTGAGNDNKGSNEVRQKSRDKGSSVDLESEVLKIISDITKYPVEMLEKGMEMEADLGIDTVKQATIFSLLGEKFQIDGDKTVNFSKYRTIGEVVNFLQSNVGNEFAALEEEATVYEKATANQALQEERNPAIDRNSSVTWDVKFVKQQVLEIFSEITRYPVEMLEEDMEIEADLGIDTIKQAMIFSAINDKFVITVDSEINMSQFKTIGAMTAFIQESISTNSAAGVEEKCKEPGVGETGDYSCEEEGIERDLCLQIPVFVEEKLGMKEDDLKLRNIWVIGDNINTVQKVSGYFSKRFKHVEEFVFEGSLETADLEMKISSFVDKPVDAIVDCTHLGILIEYDELKRNEEQKMLFLSSGARFIFYKKLLERLPEPALRIVCAVSNDGCHGYSKQQTKKVDPFYGALSGLYKSLKKEWEQSKVRIIDLGLSETCHLNDEVLSRLSDELEASADDCEVGYMDGKRGVLKIDYLDRAELKEIKLPDCPHFIVSGGGYGITSEIIVELSKKMRCIFSILGRTKLPENIEELSQLDENALEQKKREMYNDFRKSGLHTTPAVIQKEYEKLMNAISIHRMIKTVKGNGSEVLYLDCDIRDFEKLQEAVGRTVETYGPIHVLVHAAGVDKSKSLSQKTQEEFNEVFSVKAEGLCNLYRLVDKAQLKAIIAFSSISGRFGNAAQIDYCAANSFISSFMSMFKSAHKDIHTLSIAWSGWKDTGMAWRNEFVKTHAEEMGIHLIEPERGAAEFIRMLTNTLDESEIIISKGLSHFVKPEMMYGILNETPQIDWVTKRGGEINKVFKVISVKRDSLINHHRLGTTPLMPAVGFMEILAEYHSMLRGRREQYCFKRVRLTSPFKLFHEKAQEVIMSVSNQQEEGDFEAVFYTYFESKLGGAKLIELNNMTISETIGDYTSLLPLKNVENDSMMEGQALAILDSYYQKMQNSIQLGPVFMDEEGKEKNTFKYDQDRAIYSILLSKEQLTDVKYPLEKLLINPAFMDSLMQVCGIHSVVTKDKLFLPWEIEEFGVVKVPRQFNSFKTYAKVKSESEDLKVYDVILMDEAGEVYYYAKNVVMRRINL